MSCPFLVPTLSLCLCSLSLQVEIKKAEPRPAKYNNPRGGGMGGGEVVMVSPDVIPCVLCRVSISTSWSLQPL